ncbi:hypothetical protein [Variovorax atrisoli]|uniref:hypothetical protein n=1 Tax=Variovorax atrisoli TaxID=3394203 RepID=UPI0012FD9B3F|nr:hypothetical protein [Variovorax paradoxus]
MDVIIHARFECLSAVGPSKWKMLGFQGLKKLPLPPVPLPFNNRTNGMLDAPSATPCA